VGNKIFGVNLSHFLYSFPSIMVLTKQILSCLIFSFAYMVQFSITSMLSSCRHNTS
jgi:hypothetical protein